jgi:hypothetical protein
VRQRDSKFGIDVPAPTAKLAANMAVTFAVVLRACCVAVGLLLITARAAEPVSPLLGLTRDQLLSRHGEPRSQIATGSRVIYFYPRERVVLRDNVVVEVEAVAAEPAPPPSPPATTPAAEEGAAAPGARPTAPSSQSQPTPAPEPKLEIKLVRPPSKDGRPAPAAEPPRPAPIPSLPPPDATVPADSIVSPLPKRTPSADAPPIPAGTETTLTRVEPSSAVEKTANAPKTDGGKEMPAPETRPVVVAPTSVTVPPESPSNAPTYVIALAVGGLLIFLYWRYRQRQLELAASSVENTPVASEATPLLTGNLFTVEMLNGLEWRSFEELVASYYNKTGVVAVRTGSGPDSAVHIKISWKGEPRPFAYVQCIAQPTAVIDPKPLEALASALAADDIRRGYVVTSGKFNPAAREFATGKQLTLLPGDVFVEKLNALPASARTEIVKSVSAAS